MAEPILLRQLVPLDAYKPRVHLNGFPKAGLHMLVQMVGVLVGPSAMGTNGSAWLGTYKWHSFSTQWQNMRRYLWRLSCLERGCYLMGHSGFDKRTRRLMRYANIGHIFLYRDLRDVAVSQAHHIYDEDQPSWQHEHKDFYRMMGDFDATLMAVIEGIGAYPGIIERWVQYDPWRVDKNTLAITYEEMRSDTARCAGRIILYLLRKSTEILEGNTYGVELAPDDLKRLAEKMAAATEKPSETYRRGVAGGWRDEFKPEHIEAFKRSDQDGWLVRLGYESIEDWNA